MGSTHVVTCEFPYVDIQYCFINAYSSSYRFYLPSTCYIVRAHIAIILILTFTIDAFVPEDNSLGQLKVAGDYSAVFPLLTVSVFVALQISRHVVFYKMQRCRGDINAIPQALCEPGKKGKPLVIDYEGNQHELDESDYDYEDTESEEGSDPLFSRVAKTIISREDIEANFEAMNLNGASPQPMKPILKMGSKMASSGSSPEDPTLVDAMLESLSDLGNVSHSGTPTPEEEIQKRTTLKSLDELLNGPIPGSAASNERKRRKKTHRRTKSEPFFMGEANQRMDSLGSTTPTVSTPVRRPMLKRLDSYGEINQYNPSLMDQVRGRAASVDKRIFR